MESLKGSFLIASPGLADPNFVRSVVFMVEHNDEGAFGLVLTRPTPFTLDELYDNVFAGAEAFISRDVLGRYAIHRGGPVQKEAVFFLHTLEEIGRESVDPGLYMGNQTGELEGLLRHLEDPVPPRLRLFFGYSGWGAGQLEREIQAGGWLVREATLDDVFDPKAEALWSRLVCSFGGDLGILGRIPENPGLN